MSRRQYSCGLAAAGAVLPKNAAQAIAAAPEVRNFFMISLQDLVGGIEGPRETRPFRPAFEVADRYRVFDRPITCGYRNNAMRIDSLDTGGCRGYFNVAR